MRTINEIILHCTDTELARPVTLDELNSWHKARNFKRASNGNYCGYHYIIHQDGRTEGCRPVADIGQHCSMHNRNSIGIAYVGGRLAGKNVNTITQKQIESLYSLLYRLLNSYDLQYENIHLHSDFANKLCPCFTHQWFDLVFKDRLSQSLFYPPINFNKK